MCLPLLAAGPLGPVLVGWSAPSLSTTLMAASLGLTAVGTGVQAAGAVKQAKYQSSIMKRNAELARMQAQDAMARGREAESRHRMSVLQQAGAAKTRLAASGVSVASGTPASLLEEVQFMGELDAMTIRENAKREAWGYRAQAGGYEAQAGLYRQGGRYEAAGTLLSGAGTMASQWYAYKRPYNPYS